MYETTGELLLSALSAIDSFASRFSAGKDGMTEAGFYLMDSELFAARQVLENAAMLGFTTDRSGEWFAPKT